MSPLSSPYKEGLFSWVLISGVSSNKPFWSLQKHLRLLGLSLTSYRLSLLNTTDGMLVYGLLQGTQNVPGAVPSTLRGLYPFNCSMSSESRCSNAFTVEETEAWGRMMRQPQGLIAAKQQSENLNSGCSHRLLK